MRVKTWRTMARYENMSCCSTIECMLETITCSTAESTTECTHESLAQVELRHGNRPRVSNPQQESHPRQNHTSTSSASMNPLMKRATTRSSKSPITLWNAIVDHDLVCGASASLATRVSFDSSSLLAAAREGSWIGSS